MISHYLNLLKCMKPVECFSLRKKCNTSITSPNVEWNLTKKKEPTSLSTFKYSLFASHTRIQINKSRSKKEQSSKRKQFQHWRRPFPLHLAGTLHTRLHSNSHVDNATLNEPFNPRSYTPVYISVLCCVVRLCVCAFRLDTKSVQCNSGPPCSVHRIGTLIDLFDCFAYRK